MGDLLKGLEWVVAEDRHRPDLDPVGWLRSQLLHTVDRNQLSESAASDLSSHETLSSLYGGKRKTFRSSPFEQKRKCWTQIFVATSGIRSPIRWGNLLSEA